MLLLAAAYSGLVVSDLVFSDATPLLTVSRWAAVGLGAALLAGAALFVRQAVRHGRIVDPR